MYRVHRFGSAPFGGSLLMGRHFFAKANAIVTDTSIRGEFPYGYQKNV
jgi:hypothetical protein